MNIINNGNSFLLLKYRLTFAAGNQKQDRCHECDNR